MIANSNIEKLIEHLDWILDLYHDIDEITKDYRVPYGFKERPIIDPHYIQNWKSAIERA